MAKRRFCIELVLKEEIVEGRPEFSFLSRRTRSSLHDILQIIRRAASDRKVAALSLSLDRVVCGWACLSSLRRALTRFREKGKLVYCYLESAGNPEYYLATACSRIFIAPAASLNVVGLSAEMFFLREIMDRFGVTAQIRTVGEYKSAAEMFTRSGMSDPAREQWDALLDDHFREYCSAIAESRGLDMKELPGLVDSGPFTVREAKKRNLVDGACYEDEMMEKLKEDLGGTVVSIPADRYAPERFWKRLFKIGRPKIAIIDILGTIDSGESRRDRSGRHIAGADTIGKFLDHASRSRRIRAVVLRVDSPGGSAPASDFLWRKVSLLREKKPVIASIGDVAASGGYYIVSAASRILAELTSITGSIGVLGGKFVAAEMISRLAIRRESIRRGEHAELESLFLPFSSSEEAWLDRQLEEFYREGFVRKVAKGRNMSEEAVDQAGRGRIWSGARARDRGLIDEIGGLFEAVEEARRRAEIPEKKKLRLVRYYRRRRLWELLLPEFDMGLSARAALLPSFDCFDFLTSLARHTILLWMPFDIHIR